LAWKLAWKANKRAGAADIRSLETYTLIGRLAADQSNGFRSITERFDVFEKWRREAEANVKEARTSSHDLSEELEKVERALTNIKSIDSVRVKKMIGDEFEVLVSSKELERLRKGEVDRLALEEKTKSDAIELVKTQKAERRNAKLTMWVLLFTGILMTIFGSAITYVMTHEPASGKVETHP
jgi:hypothetical protein